ncbi:MAG TPA: serine hydrolase domain-containing protein, partial [Gemmatimonadaceae bacterium]|nr:serine hydrolase domain-containing protein [Gemmatimonadaceae bacterium]
MRTLLLVLALAAPSAAAQQPRRASPTAPAASLDEYVARGVRDWEVPGLALAVVKGDSVVFLAGYGVREQGRRDRVDGHTLFAVGSTTKAMTAAALGMLADEGKLRWDDPVADHLPWFRVADPYVTRELTVRDLLTHRAGLGNADLLWAGSDYSTRQILARVRHARPAYSLRSSFIYQNIMYAAAGEVVAQTAGMSWADFVRTRLFEPLGMRRTLPTAAALARQENVASPHLRIDDTIRVITNRSVDAIPAAGAVWSSAHDMARWLRFVLDSGRADGRAGGRTLLKPATVGDLLSPQALVPAS